MEKRLLLFTTVLCCTMLGNAQFSGKGSGTSDNPYQITNADELSEMRNSLSACYRLMNDIDLTEWIAENSPIQGWTPIGNENNPFVGIFDGNNKVITGIYIKRPNTNNIGLFGYAAFPCVIENVCIKSPTIIGNDNVGALTGYCHGGSGSNYNNFMQIRSVRILSPKIQANMHVGGLVGYSRRVIIMNNCVVVPDINGGECVGGVAGGSYIYNGSNWNIENDSICNNIVAGGTITGTNKVGGILGYSGYIYSGFGYNNTVSISINGNCCSSIVKGVECVGGLCGRINSVSSDKYSYASSETAYKRQMDSECCRHHIFNNHFAGTVMSNDYGSGIIGGLFCEIHVASNRIIYNTYAQPYLDIYQNICSGRVFSNTDVAGIVSVAPHIFLNGEETSIDVSKSTDSNTITHNVFGGDTLSARYSNSNVYRISGSSEGVDNFALSTANLLIDGQSLIIEEDNVQQGTSFGIKTLMKQSTYEGLGFDFTKHWAITEGESFPYNISQCRPAKVTSFKAGINSNITGTTIGKSSLCNGSVFVTIGDSIFEGTVINGHWSIQLKEVTEGQEAKVIVIVDGMMPSIPSVTIAEKGTSEPDPITIDDTPDTDISLLNNVIYLGKIDGLAGQELTLSFQMKNSATIRGFQFDLYLPDGVTAVKNAKGRIQGALSSGRLPEDDEHTLTIQEQADGAIRFLCSSLYDETFTGSEGEIATLQVKIGENMEDGDYPIIIKDMKLTETNISNFYETSYLKSTLTVSSFTPGDVNGDAKVDVSDYTGVANHILGIAQDVFIEKAGDVDGSGTIDVSDYTGIANFIMTGSFSGRSNLRKAKSLAGGSGENVIYVQDAELPVADASGAEINLSIRMRNTANIRGFQFDMYLPEGFSVVKNNKGRIIASLSSGRLPEDDEHTLTVQEQADGAIRFLCSSLYDETFTGSEGEIATVKVKIADNIAAGNYAIQLKNMKLTETNISNYYETELMGSVFKVTGGEEPNVCAKPTISYAQGKLTFYCETEGAICQSTITDADINSFSGNEVELTVTYNISVYATKAGYENSEVATATLCWIDVEPQTEGVEDAVAEVKAMPVMIQTQGGTITVQGTSQGTNVSVYSVNGMLQGSAIANEGIAILNTSLQPGSVAVVKIGDRSVKVLMK